MARHLSLAGMLAVPLSQGRAHPMIETADLLATCYIADPVRFLAFWHDALSCVEALRIDCGLDDPAWTYQWKLTEQVKSVLESQDGGYAYGYSADLTTSLLEAAKLVRATSPQTPQIDVPHFLLAIESDSRFARLFAAGFRGDLAHVWINRMAESV